MIQETYDAVRQGVDKLCNAHEALVQAASLCYEALEALTVATTGSAQPEVNNARMGYLEVDQRAQDLGSELLRTTVALSAYSAVLDPEAGPAPLSEHVRQQVNEDSPYAQARELEDHEYVPGKLLSAAYSQSSTTFQTCEQGKEMRIEVPGGYIDIAVRQTAHGSAANIEYVEVTEGTQQGKGTYLVGTAAREASLRGCENLTGYFITPYSLRALARVVGKENIIIQSPGSSRSYFQTTDYNDAVAKLNEQEATHPDKNLKGVRARVDLRERAVLTKLFRKQQ